MNIVKIKWNISFSACFIEKTTVVFELLKNVWINSSWDDLYSNLSKTSSKINIFTVKSPLWDLQVSRSQRSEEVCCSRLQVWIDPSGTSPAQLITFLQWSETTSQSRQNVPFMFKSFMLIAGLWCLKRNYRMIFAEFQLNIFVLPL